MHDHLQDAADMSASKAATRSLASLLESHLAAAGGRGGGATSSAASADHTREAALADASIARLSQRIRSLEADLLDARSELQAAQRRRAMLPPPSSKGGSGRGAAASSASQQHQRNASSSSTPRALAERLDAQMQAAVGAGVPAGGDSDDALTQLLESCERCAQLHDKAMERAVEQHGFARNRANAAANLGDVAKRDAARRKVDDVRASADKARAEAGRLEQLVTALEASLSTSESFARLRPLAMEVNEVIWRVYTSHSQLDAPAAAPASSGASGHKRTYTMEEILQAETKGGGNRGGGRGGRGNAASHADTAPPPREEQDNGYQPFGAGFGVSGGGGDDEGGPPSAYYEQQEAHQPQAGQQPAQSAHSSHQLPPQAHTQQRGQHAAQAPAPTAPPTGWAPAVTGRPASGGVSGSEAQGGTPLRQYTPDEFMSAAMASQTQGATRGAVDGGNGVQQQVGASSASDDGAAAGTASAANPALARAEDAAARLRMTFGQALATPPPAGRGGASAGREAGRGRGRSGSVRAQRV